MFTATIYIYNIIWGTINKNVLNLYIQTSTRCTVYFLGWINMNITILDWNDEIVKSLTPNIIVLSIFILTWIFGNGLVLFVYTLQIKNSSDERYFIPILAVFVMIACVYLGSFAIYECLNQVTFSNSIVCKTAEFFAGFTTFVPIFESMSSA